MEASNENLLMLRVLSLYDCFLPPAIDLHLSQLAMCRVYQSYKQKTVFFFLDFSAGTKSTRQTDLYNTKRILTLLGYF